jgi:hypothetical protein
MDNSHLMKDSDKRALYLDDLDMETSEFDPLRSEIYNRFSLGLKRGKNYLEARHEIESEISKLVADFRNKYSLKIRESTQTFRRIKIDEMKRNLEKIAQGHNVFGYQQEELIRIYTHKLEIIYSQLSLDERKAYYHSIFKNYMGSFLGKKKNLGKNKIDLAISGFPRINDDELASDELTRYRARIIRDFKSKLAHH